MSQRGHFFGVGMKLLISMLSFIILFGQTAGASTGNLEFDIGNPAIFALGKTSDRFMWLAAHGFVSSRVAIGIEYAHFEDRSGGYSYSGPSSPRRDYGIVTEQYGLRFGGYLSGVASSSFYGFLSSGLARRDVTGSVDRSVTQFSGYGTIEVGYQFVFSKHVLLKTALVSAKNDFAKTTDFTNAAYTELIDAVRDGGGIRISLGALF